MYKYRIILYWSEEDSVFIANVPELPGCMAHGYTQEEALHNVNDAIGLWLDTARDFGDAVPEPKGEPSSGATPLSRWATLPPWPPEQAVLVFPQRLHPLRLLGRRRLVASRDRARPLPTTRARPSSPHSG